MLDAGCEGATQPFLGWKRDNRKKIAAEVHAFYSKAHLEVDSSQERHSD